MKPKTLPRIISGDRQAKLSNPCTSEQRINWRPRRLNPANASPMLAGSPRTRRRKNQRYPPTNGPVYTKESNALTGGNPRLSKAEAIQQATATRPSTREVPRIRPAFVLKIFQARSRQSPSSMRYSRSKTCASVIAETPALGMGAPSRSRCTKTGLQVAQTQDVPYWMALSWVKIRPHTTQTTKPAAGPAAGATGGGAN